MKQKKKKGNFKTGIILATTIVFLDWFFQQYFRKIGFGVANFGISFGLAGELDWFWKAIMPSLFLIAILYEYWSKKKISVYLCCLALGGVGNLIPRVIFGSVWDYVEIPFLSLWINLSDVLISVSVLSYILIADGDSSRI